MRYFDLEFMGDITDESLCLLTQSDAGLGAKDYCLTRGERIGGDFPADACLVMTKDWPGMKLSTVLGNSCAFLVCHADMRAVIGEVCTNEIEFLPVAVLNHRGKPVSRDYVIVNVIGTVDCLDEPASKVVRSGKGKVVKLGAPVIDAKKLPPGLHLLRPAQAPSRLFMSLELGKALAARKFTNLRFNEVKVVNQ
jgi:hypothetical protein